MRDRDYSEASAYLARLFGEVSEHAVELRSVPNEHGTGRTASLFTREVTDIELHCARWDGPGRAIYYGEVTRLTGRAQGRREDLAELTSLWTDTDCDKLGLDKAGVARAMLSELEMPPSILIDSGYGIHGKWLLREALDVSLERSGATALEAELVAALRGLAGLVAGDPAVCDLARVMRLVGTHNTKRGDLVPCRVLEASWARYEWRELQEMLDRHRPVVRPPEAAKTVPATRGDNPFTEFARQFAIKAPIDVRQRLLAMTYLGEGEAAVHQTQLQVSASLVRAGLGDDDIVALVLDATHRAAGFDGERWNWSREEANLRRMITDWRSKLALATPPREQQQAGAAIPASAAIVQFRPQRQQAEPADTEPAIEEEEAPQLLGFPLHDLGNAMRLIVQYKTALRYVTGIGWHVWDGRRYAIDPANCAARRLAHQTSRTMLLQAFEQPALSPQQKKRRDRLVKFAVNSGMARATGSMLSQAEPHLDVVADDLDRDPVLLNCHNGTAQEKLPMKLRPHAQEDLLTKMAGTHYDPAALCPIWEKFVFDIFDGDSELVAFVQRALGYSVTGLTTEQVVFILHGSGSNGKTVLLETVAAVLGDYAQQCPSETFISQEKGSRIPSDIARLAGARFVSVVETEHERNLAEGLVKQATGGDRMAARFLHKEWFEFTPKFKLWLATNHKPRIRGSDYAIWRRILLLPFNVTFVDADQLVDGKRARDPDLKNKLIPEYPGILAWMLRGCEAWQKGGLRPPSAVVNATESYQDSQDNVSAFIRDNCHLSRGLECASGILYAAYENWCDENDEPAIKQRAFVNNLDERGYPSGPRTNRTRLRKGIDIKEEFRAAAEQRQVLDKAGGGHA